MESSVTSNESSEPAASREASIDPEQLPRDPESRPTDEGDEEAIREKNHDKTLADSFPTSDPPSTIPDPGSSV